MARSSMPLSPRSPFSKALQAGYRRVPPSFSGDWPYGWLNDASIQRIAYLTYTVVSNAIYNVDACLVFCTSVAVLRFHARILLLS